MDASPHIGPDANHWRELGEDVHLQVVACRVDEKPTAPDLPPQDNEVVISGSARGILWLAQEVARVALSGKPGYHQHLDKEACCGHHHSDGDWWLTISLNEGSKQVKEGESIERLTKS